MLGFHFDPPTPKLPDPEPEGVQTSMAWMTPIDIEMKQFHTTKRLKDGYDQNEVDAFLELVASEYKAMQLQLNQQKAIMGGYSDISDTQQMAKVVVEQAKEGLPDLSGLENLSRVLSGAEKVATQIEEDAQNRAGEILVGAADQANRKISEANQKAQQIVADAYAGRQATIEQLDNTIRELSKKVDELGAKKQSYAEWAKSVVETLGATDA